MLVIACEVVKQITVPAMLATAISNRAGRMIISRLGCVPSILLRARRLAGKWMGEFFCLHGDFRNDGSFNVLGFCKGFRLP